MSPVRVLIAEDHELYRRGLTELLRAEGFDVVATATRAEDAIALAAEHRPDVVVMDISLRGGSGIEATRTIKERDPAVRVVALTGSREHGDVLRAVRAGADGYLTKDSSSEGLTRALHGVLRGEVAISRTLAACLVDEVRRGDRRRVLAAMVPDREHLTPRQLEILELLAAGASTGEVAAKLFLSVETVRWHVKSILRKLDVRSRAEAVACLRELRTG